MRVLILGTSGYLGRHTVRALRAESGVRVILGGRSPGAYLRLDLATTEPVELAAALRALGPDAVVNCAGAVAGNAHCLAAVNTRGPAVLCEALRRAAPAARLVHVGSAAEYGANETRLPVPESAPASPLSFYGATKLAGTMAVTGSELDAVVLRVFHPVGPGAPTASLPGRLAAELRRAGPCGRVRVGDLSACHDFVDVRDVARAAVRAALADGPLPSVVNIGSGTVHPARAVAEGLVKASGFDGSIECVDGVDGVDGVGGMSGAGGVGGVGALMSVDGFDVGEAPQPPPEALWGVPWQCADTSAARAALGWSPGRSLQESLTDLWRSAAGATAEARR